MLLGFKSDLIVIYLDLMVIEWMIEWMIEWVNEWMIEWMIEWIWLQIVFFCMGYHIDCMIFYDDMGITIYIYIWDNHGYQGGTPANRVVFT